MWINIWPSISCKPVVPNPQAAQVNMQSCASITAWAWAPALVVSTPPSMEKFSSTKPTPGARKVGDCWSKPYYSPFPKSPLNLFLLRFCWRSLHLLMPGMAFLSIPLMLWSESLLYYSSPFRTESNLLFNSTNEAWSLHLFSGTFMATLFWWIKFENSSVEWSSLYVAKS